MTQNGLTAHNQSPTSLLVIAHPGHELRLVNWLAKTQPDVVVLTDGSGGGGHGRVAATQRVIAASGARSCVNFGSHTDREIYQAMLSGSPALFLDMVCRLIATIRLGRYHTIVRDPHEGYNPTHDLCAVLVDAAANIVWQRHGQRIRIYDFPLTELSNFQESDALHKCVLSEAERAFKQNVVRAYVALSAEVESAFQREGPRLFREEVLRDLSSDSRSGAQHRRPPFYETFGEQQRAAGRYATVIRYSEHMLPIETAIRGMADYNPYILRQGAEALDQVAAHVHEAP